MIGLTFHGLHSSKFKLNMTSTNRGIFPQATRKTAQIPLVSGVIDFGLDTYNELPIKIAFTYNFHNDLSNMRMVARDIRGWLYNDGQYYDLIFDDEPDRKYKAKVVNAVDLQQGKSAGSFTVEFMCNPPHQYLLNNAPVTLADEQARLLWDTAALEGNQYIKEFTGSGTMRITNSGTMAVKPIIKLIGYVPSNITLTYRGTWQYKSSIRNDSIVIDCAAETVTRGSDGVNLYGYVSGSFNTFFILQPGQCEISVSAIGIGAWPNSLTVVVQFEPMGG